MLPLLLTGRVNPWRVLGIGAAAAVVLMALYVRSLSIQLKRDEVVYRNPAVRIQVRRIRIEGPVRIVTRVVEVEGRKETVTEEVRGEITETTDSLTVSRPVLPGSVNGWVGGIGADGWASWAPKDLAGYGGYRFGRLEVLGRYQVGGKAGAVLLWRF